MDWLINRRRMMYNKALSPTYIVFESHEVWRICCENWGDYNETVITDNGDNTVDIVESFISKSNTTEKKRIVLNTQSNVDNSGGTYTEGTTKEAIGITKKQCAAVTAFGQVFRDNALLSSFKELQYFTSVTTIAYYTFRGANFTNIIVPGNITSIGYSPWGNLSDLNDIVMLGSTPPSIDLRFNGWGSSGLSWKVYVPDDAYETYAAANNWSTIAGWNRLAPMSEYVES